VLVHRVWEIRVDLSARDATFLAWGNGLVDEAVE
jgi:hypothetical protein